MVDYVLSLSELYVTVSEKTDYLVQISDIEILLHVVARYSLYTMVKSESQERIPFSSNARPDTGSREIIFSRNEANL